MAEKSAVEIVLMPIVVAVVGFFGTYFITREQELSAQAARQAQIESARELAEADRHVKILDIFAEKITSPDETQKVLALKMLRAVEPELAEKLASAVSEVALPQSVVKKAAQQVVQESRARAEALPAPRVYLHIQAEEDRQQARSIEQGLEASGFDVPGIEWVGRRAPKKTELRYFRQAEEEMGREIVEHLRTLGVEVDLKYISGYENSTGIRPRHYELWLE